MEENEELVELKITLDLKLFVSTTTQRGQFEFLDINNRALRTRILSNQEMLELSHFIIRKCT